MHKDTVNMIMILPLTYYTVVHADLQNALAKACLIRNTV